MTNYLVEHTWDVERSNEVKSIVGAIIEKDRKNELPIGYQLLGVMLSTSEPKATCVWEAPSKTDLQSLLGSVNPPTRHTVSEYQILFGVSKLS
jgi:hypothetical protein